MFGLFKNKAATQGNQQTPPSETQANTPTAPGTEIHYSPTLIDELKGDHQQLLAAYMSIKASFDQGNYAAVSQQLNDFRFGLHSHLLTENVRLYIYVGSMLSHDGQKAEMIRTFRHEMEGIGKTALRLLKKYEAINLDTELADPFARDFAAIGSILTDRIKKEESVLYPLYLSCQ
ncbi:MAG TPA: hemerythrin domain-containing protein [Gammaproteobacteria bacterium]